MKHFLTLILIALCFGSSLLAQGPWKLKLYCPEESVRLHIDLYEESIEVPGMEMFGPMNGYLNGNVYGVWTVTSFNIQDDKTATLRLSNDLGSETQKVTLTQQSDSLYLLHLDGLCVIKRVVGKKLVKVPVDFKMQVNDR